MIVYHGSNKIIEKPLYGFGKKYNDYGLGFYCTESKELAKEWACDKIHDGYANAYRLNISDLKVLDLNSDNYNVLNWLSILLKNRTFNCDTDMEISAKRFLETHYSVDIDQYDVIRGYRADDSYFRFAEDFLSNTISIEKLEEAMHLGRLGEQIVLKSKKAFDNIEYIKQKSEYADSNIYYAKKNKRDEQARSNYKRIKTDIFQGTFIRDIIREGGNI